MLAATYALSSASVRMDATLPLLRGRISLEDALKKDEDMVQELSYPEKRFDFWAHLYLNRPLVEQTISMHLNIPTTDLRLSEVKEWSHGSFNACLPFCITASKRSANLPEKGIIRFALPYKIGEEHCPGNVDEKIRSEAATYIWLQKNCPSVPIPRLFGFGLPGGQSFTSLGNVSFFSRIWWHVRNAIATLVGLSQTAPYRIHQRPHLFGLGYMVIEFVQEGRKLSDTWFQHNSDQERRANLFRGLSRVMLSLTDRPLPRIASWTISDLGILTLTNRPLTLALHQRENNGIPAGIPLRLTYTSAEAYYLDLLTSQDNQIRYQPNAIHDTEDGEMQLASLMAMKALVSQYTDSQGRGGPFYMTLTDLHPSNIFVDNDWNITKIIDLEWACARPLEMTYPPYWISGHHAMDDIADHGEEYAAANEHFFECFEKAEEEVVAAATAAISGDNQDLARATTLRDHYVRKSPWYYRALDHSPSMVYLLYANHIRPRFFKRRPGKAFNDVVAPLWTPDMAGFIAGKLQDQEKYFEQLRDIYREAAAARENEEGE